MSSGCRDKLTALYEKAQAIKNGCESETDRLCEGQATPVAKLYLCLRWHEAEVSSRCRAALNP